MSFIDASIGYYVGLLCGLVFCRYYYRSKGVYIPGDKETKE